MSFHKQQLVERLIRSESDLPPVNAIGEHPLEAGTKYVFEDIVKNNGAVILSNPLRLPDDSQGFGIQLTTSSDNQTVVVYEGSGAFIRGQRCTLVFLRFIDVLGDGTNTMYDIDGEFTDGDSSFASFCLLFSHSINDFLDAGTIRNFGVLSITDSFASNNGEGLTIDSCNRVINNNYIIIHDSDSGNGNHFTVKGACGNITLTSNFEPFTGESFLKLDPTLDSTLVGANINLTFDDSNGGAVYPTGATGSITAYDDNKSTASITQFSDNSSFQTNVTSAAHGLSNDDIVTITGTTNYNGTYKISGVTTNTFDIRILFVADDATGTWDDKATTVTSSTHGLSNGDTVLIDGTTNYDGGFEIYGVTTNTYDIHKDFVADDSTGTWDTNSFKQDDIRVTIRGTPGVKESTIFGNMFYTGNATATTISTINTFVKIAGTTIQGPVERFQMTADNELTYIAKDEKSLLVNVSLDVSKVGGGTQSFEFAVFKNNVQITTAIKTVSLTTAVSPISLILADTANEDDFYDIRVQNIDGTDNVLCTNMQFILTA